MEHSEIRDLADETEGAVAGPVLLPGTWWYWPMPPTSDYEFGYLVLRDIPKIEAIVDGIKVPLRGGFRGFMNIPPGMHEVVIIGYSSTKPHPGVRINIPEGGCAVLLYNADKNRIEVDREWGATYISKALRGILDSHLYCWPTPSSQ